MEKEKAEREAKARLEEIQTQEVSLVPRAANRFPFLLIKRQAFINKGAIPYKSFPMANESMSWDSNASVKRIREWASSDGSGDKEKVEWSKYRTAFLWYDSSDEESFGSYKMPIIDIVEGGPKVVWRAVSASLAAMQGARGGVIIPEADRPSVLSKIKRYYDDFGKEWTVEKGDSIKQKISLPILNIGEDEQRLVTGVVLVPDREDGQGDIITSQAIQKAAHRFLAKRQQPKALAKLGVMHKHYDKELELVESYIMPVDVTINGREIKKGSWIVTVRVLDDGTWSQVKKGEIREFSLQGSGRGWRLDNKDQTS